MSGVFDSQRSYKSNFDELLTLPAGYARPSFRLPVCAFSRPVHIDSGWLGSRVVSVLDPEGPGFMTSQPRRCWVTVLSKLFAPIVPLFTKQRNW